MGMEVCATLGMLDGAQAKALREAGLTAYNHNLDTSPEFYPKVTSSRNYEDRLNTIAAVRDAGISVCCGGILGLGALYTLVPIRPRWRGERRSLRTFAVISLRPGSPAFNPDTPRRLSTPTDAFQLHPDIIARTERPGGAEREEDDRGGVGATAEGGGRVEGRSGARDLGADERADAGEEEDRRARGGDARGVRPQESIRGVSERSIAAGYRHRCSNKLRLRL